MAEESVSVRDVVLAVGRLEERLQDVSLSVARGEERVQAAGKAFGRRVLLHEDNAGTG